MANEVILDERVKGILNYYSNNMLTTMSQIDHVSEIFYSDIYRTCSKQFSQYIAARVMDKKEKDIRETFNVFEKNLGFISRHKRELMEKQIQDAGTRAGVSASIIMGSIPLLFSHLEKKIDQKNYADFFLGWTAYLNQDGNINAMITTNTAAILRSFGKNMPNDVIRKKLEELRKLGSHQPRLSKRYMNSLNHVEVEALNSIAKLLISPLDMDNVKVKDRSMEFLCDFFDMSYTEAEQKIDDIYIAQDHVSKLSICTAINYLSFFKSFIDSDSDALDMAEYDISLDPQMDRCIENNEKISKWNRDIDNYGVEEGLEKNSFEDDFGEKKEITEDIVEVSNGVMEDTIMPDREQGMEFMEATMDSEEYFGGEWYGE